MSNFNEWEQMYGELDIIKERRRFLRKRICGLIRKHYVGSSEPKLQ